jgi:hypothetical protein
MFLESLQSILGSAPVRRTVDAGFGWYARQRAAETDAIRLADRQQETLLALVRQARDTRFGREHDFAGIHSIADYQARVPLRDYEAFWREYWQAGFPRLSNVTWPGSYPYFALSSGTTSGTTKYVPITRQMLRSNERAATTAIAWLRAARPDLSLFTGKMFFLGGSTNLQPAGTARNGPLMGDLSGIVAHEASSLIRPYTYPPEDLSLLGDWERKLELLAERSVRERITAVTGVPSWLLVLFDRLRQVTGRDKLIDIWPQLKLIVHGGTKFDPYRELFRATIGSDEVQFLETYPASEGFVAAEDPRHGLLRLLPDHHIFYEFVPAAELGSPSPVRHTAAEVIPGVQYAVILTTCAGLWSYILGDTVCFESCDPPLLRFTGRTQQFLSAFGEHLIGEEIERAISSAALSSDSSVVDFHVGPIFPQTPQGAGRHRYYVEFVRPPADLHRFARVLDAALSELNEDYRAHRQGDLTLAGPEVVPVPRGGFACWMKSRGKLGGQHKVPRMDNTGELAGSLDASLAAGAV